MDRNKKPNKIEYLKKLTRYLTVGDVKTEEVLHKIIQPYLKNRIISYLIRYPKIINYINNNLNNLFYFDKYDDKDWLETFKYIFESYNLKKTNQLFFTKAKQPKRNPFKSELEKFFNNDEFQIFNSKDLNELYRLYEARIIDESIIDNIRDINNGKPSGKTKNISLDVSSAVNKRQENKLIDNLESKIKNYISNRLFCKNCPLFSQPKYPIYANATEEKVDCIVVGDFPTSEDFLSDNQYLNLIKILLDQNEISYVATNLVLCKPKTDEIPNKNKTISNCSGVTEHIHKVFDTQFKILIGSNVKSFFKLKGPITKLNGELINNNFIISHPDSSTNQFKTGLIKLKEFLMEYNKKKINRINMEKGLIQVDKFKDINSSLNTFTLFDIKIIDERILYILIDNEGTKKYITEDISFPVYIKQGKYSDCAFMIDSEPDLVVYLSAQQKYYLNNLLNKKLQNKVNLVY